MADTICCSERILKRNQDVRGEFLDLGDHYRHGPSTNRSNLWNVEAMIGAVAHRGLADAKSDELQL